jgi:hypothetical protein
VSLARVIILEGCDGSGKTTLATRMKDECGYRIVKTNAPRPGDDVFELYTDAILEATEGGDRVAFDRHYLGELIYGPLLRGRDGLGPQGRDLLERLIAGRGVRLVICAPPWKRLVEGWRKKDDLLKREDQLRAVHDGYLRETKRLGIATYDWTREDLPDLSPPPSLPPGVTGYLEADILWVGERPGKARVRWDLPFHCRASSARYLWESLQGLNGERRWAWTNAFTATGEPRDLNAVVASLPRLRRVVALGDTAWRECYQQCVDAVKVPHPQYWSRFHHHEQEEYREMLRKATQC